MGEQLEQVIAGHTMTCEDVLLDEVRLQEELPIEETKVFAVSLDGVNVRLNTPGKKKGRPTERPKDEDAMSRETPSCFKNAMVGVCGLYGDVPEITNPNASEKFKVFVVILCTLNFAFCTCTGLSSREGTHFARCRRHFRQRHG